MVLVLLKVQLTNWITITELRIELRTRDHDALRKHSLVYDFSGLCLYAGKIPIRCIDAHGLLRTLALQVALKVVEQLVALGILAIAPKDLARASLHALNSLNRRISV